MNVLNTVRDQLTAIGYDKSYYIALSGGLDSFVLSHSCLALREELALNLHVIHVHHGLQPAADHWRDYCVSWCQKNSLPIIVEHISIMLHAGESLEAIAREKRYAVFARYIDKQSILLTAHQQNDQVETFLLQLLRGAGLKGLSAMPAIKPFAAGLHARPLLEIDRQALETYAKDAKLVWCEDQSNHNVNFTRNYIRHKFLKVLTERWPSALNTVSRSIAHCAEANHLLEDYAKLLLTEIKDDANTLSVSKLKLLNKHKQKLVLRHWIAQSGYLLPPTSKCNTILNNMLNARNDAQPCVKWDQVRLYRYKDNLYLYSEPESQAFSNLNWQLTSPYQLNDIFSLYAKAVLGKGLKFSIKEVRVGFRKGGEKIKMQGKGRRLVKHLLQEWQVPPWLRSTLPFLYLDEELIAIVGYYYHPDYIATKQEKGWEIVTERRETNLSVYHNVDICHS